MLIRIQKSGSYSIGRTIKSQNPFGEQFGKILKLQCGIVYDPALPLSIMNCRENSCVFAFRDKNVHCTIYLNNEKGWKCLPIAVKLSSGKLQILIMRL